MPFWLSIGVLGLFQAALVALPGELPESPFAGLRSRWWALLPAGSVVVVIAAVNFYSGSADFLTYLALVGVPPLAAVALGCLLRGSRPPWALLALPLFAIAWAAIGSLAGETAATLLSGLACISLGWLLVGLVPDLWLRWGIYAMAAIDAYLVAGDLLQGPNSVLNAAAPGADLPRLQIADFGSARMGFGDLFIAALVGCLLATSRPSAVDGPIDDAMRRESARRQWVCAGLVGVLALLFDLLFFAVDELPATVPVALALALAMRLVSERG